MRIIRGSVPVAIAAYIFGKDSNWIRLGIREGWLDIGVCNKGNRRTNYYISPKLLYEKTGYLWKGEKTIEEVKHGYRHTSGNYR